jgi:hypothetical protein
MPEGFELIGIDESESQLDLYLVDRPEEGRCLELINSRDGCSYANLPGDTAPRRTLAPGLTVYICMQALRLRVWPQRLMRAVFVPPASAPILPQLAEFHRLALGEGYQPFWFAPDPGDTVVVAAREETVVIAQQTPPGGLVVSVAANSVADFSQFAGVLMDDLGLRRA